MQQFAYFSSNLLYDRLFLFFKQINDDVSNEVIFSDILRVDGATMYKILSASNNLFIVKDEMSKKFPQRIEKKKVYIPLSMALKNNL